LIPTHCVNPLALIFTLSPIPAYTGEIKKGLSAKYCVKDGRFNSWAFPFRKASKMKNGAIFFMVVGFWVKPTPNLWQFGVGIF
jgi:hypothetical protein